MNRSHWYFVTVAGLAVGVTMTGCSVVNPPDWLASAGLTNPTGRPDDAPAPTLVPVGFTGPTSTIRDSVTVVDKSEANLFYAASIDGQRVETTKDTTLLQSRGQGATLTPMTMSHRVISHLLTVNVVGENVFAMPLLSMTHSIFRVKGDIEFVPEADKTYTVRGSISADHCTVWVEEDGNGNVIGQKIDIDGATAKNNK